MRTTEPLIAVRGLVAGYGRVEVLHGVDLDLATGSITALLGANGAGKTTLMRALAGLLPATAGSVRLEGREIVHAPAHARVDAGIVLVPEGRMVFAMLTVEQNLRLGAIARRARDGVTARMDEVFRRFPRLYERRSQLAGSLSGGEQQMLAIGRGLMAKPRVLLLDEPSLGLAPVMVSQVFAIIEDLRRNGYAILLSEQNTRAGPRGRRSCLCGRERTHPVVRHRRDRVRVRRHAARAHGALTGSRLDARSASPCSTDVGPGRGKACAAATTALPSRLLTVG